MHSLSAFCFGTVYCKSHPIFGSCWGWKLWCGQQEIPLRCHLGPRYGWELHKSSILCANKYSTGAQNHGKIFCHLGLSSLAQISSSCYPSCLVPCCLLLPLQIFCIMMAKEFGANTSCLRSPGLTASTLHTCFSSDSVNLRLQHSHAEWEKENSNWWSILCCIFKNNCIVILCPLKSVCFFSITAGLGFNFSLLVLITEQFSV